MIMAANLPPPPPDGDRNRGAAIIITQSVFVTISLALVLARVYVRTLITRNFGSDDVFIILGMVSSIIVLALTVLMVHYGVGRHVYYVSLQPQQLQQAIKWEFILQPFLLLSTMFTKISVSLFLLRIFGTRSHWRWVLYSIIIFSILAGLLSSFTIIAQCQPVEKLWNPLLPGNCWGPGVLISIGYFNGAVSTACDWILASLPTVFIWGLQMKVKDKAAICILMGMGFFSGICVLVRTVLLKNLASTDITWNILDLAIWSLLEGTVGIIAACIPTLKPLFTTSVQNPWSAGSRNRARSTGGSAAQGEDTKHRLHNINLNHLRRLSNKDYSHIDGSQVTIQGTNGYPKRASVEGIRKDLEFSVETSSNVVNADEVISGGFEREERLVYDRVRRV